MSSRHFYVSLTDLNSEAAIRPYEDLHRDADWRQSARYLERIRPLLDRIPPIERDVLSLYYFQGKRQDVIGRLLGLSQQAVSHRLHAAHRRIIFMLQQVDVTPEQMAVDLLALLPNPFTVKVLCDFAVTSSQTVTAKRLKVPQQRVCWHLNAGLRTLRASPYIDGAFYTQYFEDLRRHRNILREVLAGRRKQVPDGSHVRYAPYARGAASSYSREAGVSHAAG